MLELKELKKEIKLISREMLIRQSRLMDVDLSLKILALLFVLEGMESEGDKSLRYEKEKYVYPMLRHSLTVNIFGGLSEVLNNLSVSNTNEDVTLLIKIKKYFEYLFFFAKNMGSGSKVADRIVQMIY